MNTKELLVLLMIACTCVHVWSQSSCAKFNSQMGATFDLTDLLRAPNQPPYLIEDGDIPCTPNKVEPNYTYIFNVCGTVSGTLPSACKLVSGVNTAGALQINRHGTETTSDDWCYAVGYYKTPGVQTKLLNSGDPTKGISVTYFGDKCGNGKQRQFVMEMTCEDKLSPVPTHALETEGCVYTMSMPSVYGCPLECPVANRHICGGNGHCAYDTDKLAARCFCNKGYTGKDCSQTESSEGLNYSPALLGLIITLFIIVVLLAGSIVYMIRQMDAYKEDLAHYQSLKGGDEDSAVV